MTDTAKAAVWDAIFLPWGGVHAITGSATLDARFPGQWFQLESGLHYNWHRQYDPSIGRYTQPDPLGFVDGPSVYGYVRGMPQRLVDKDGRASHSFCIANPTVCMAAGTTVVRIIIRQCIRLLNSDAPPISESEKDRCQNILYSEEDKCNEQFPEFGKNDPWGYKDCIKQARLNYYNCMGLPPPKIYFPPRG